MTGARVHDQVGLLVDYDQVVIRVHQVERYLFLCCNTLWLRGRKFPGYMFACRKDVVLPGWNISYEHIAVSDKPLGSAPGNADAGCDESIQPPASVVRPGFA
jgi:hypothetical protein